jgi:hypothetical protein
MAAAHARLTTYRILAPRQIQATSYAALNAVIHCLWYQPMHQIISVSMTFPPSRVDGRALGRSLEHCWANAWHTLPNSQSLWAQPATTVEKL